MMTRFIPRYLVVYILLITLLAAHSLNSRNNLTVRRPAARRIQQNSRISIIAADLRTRYCYEDKCRCFGDEADCSQNYGNLTFVPKLPEGIDFLNFTFNNLTHIRTRNFFANVTKIRGLDLSDNNLMSIHPHAFHVFTNLDSVFLNYNYNLSIQALFPVLSTETLERIDLRHGRLTELPQDLFHRFPLPNLRTLYIYNNRLEMLNLTALMPLSKLAILGVGNNHLSQVITDYMPNLEKLNLGTNALFSFPVTCRENSSMFPRLTHLELDHNLIESIDGEVCLPQLKELQLSGNWFFQIVMDTFSAARFPKLVELFLQSMSRVWTKLEKYAFRNPSLNRIDLMHNILDFASDGVDPYCFAGCPSLIDLQISETQFDRVNGEKFQQLFKHLTHLQTLYMGNCHLSNVTKNAFRGLRSLSKLALYKNTISSLPGGIFDHLNLTYLDISGNQLSVIKQSTFSPSMRNRLEHLDLSGNPFDCSCDFLWFQAWFSSNTSLFSHSYTSYDCKNMPGTGVASFYMNPQACLMSHAAYIFVVVSIAMLWVVLTLISTLYRYRWHIRLLLYEVFRGRDDIRRRRHRERHFDYDVFVSYAIGDCDWVLRRMMPELEGRLGLRLCLHQRDFIPGNNIADNIVESVHSSKKMLMVFSTSYARSQWCQFELALCLRHVMDYDDVLVIVYLHDVASRDLTSTMMAVNKTTTYIQWGEGEEAETSFGGRLRIALHEILPEPVD